MGVVTHEGVWKDLLVVTSASPDHIRHLQECQGTSRGARKADSESNGSSSVIKLPSISPTLKLEGEGNVRYQFHAVIAPGDLDLYPLIEL